MMTSATAKKYGFGKWMLGKHHSEETKRKMSLAKKSRNHLSPGFSGHHHTEKTRMEMSRMKKRDKCYRWKGGISLEKEIIKSGIEYRLWRESVFARDNFTCQKCGNRRGELNAHHIQNFAQYPELRFAIDNGITFCDKCHNKFHKIYGTKDNNKGQIEKFID